jgi:WD40 repeat protein
LPAHIQKEEFEEASEHIEDANVRELVKSWYQLDENADPAEYLLKPRGQDYQHRPQWEPLEQHIRRALLKGARLARRPAADLLKYQASATHQEILAGLGATARDREHVFAFYRDPAENEDPELTELKEYLRNELAARLLPFPPGGYTELCEVVEKSLREVITATADRFPTQNETTAHDEFARERTRHFFGRKDVLAQIERYLRSGVAKPLVVHGPSGCGKSAILAKASEGLDAVRRFVGATADSSSGIALLQSLCVEIGQRYGKGAAAPGTFKDVSAMFLERLRLATVEDPLVLFVDALDQLAGHDPAAAMSWVPSELPPHCRLVLSTTRIPPPLGRAELVGVPELPVADADLVLQSWLDEAGRKLQAEQLKTLRASFERSGLPLYLKLAFEEARLWRSFDPPDQCLLGEGLPGIVDRLCERLEDESNHGKTLVSRTFGYLAAARYGLTEDEMLAVLTKDDAVWNDVVGQGEWWRHDPPIRQLPVIVWSRLYLDLEPYLTEAAVPGGTVIRFFHRQLAQRISTRYLNAENRELRHQALAVFFSEQQSEHRRANRRTFAYTMVASYNHRKLTELPYQLCLAGAWGPLERLLTDINFLDIIARAGRIRDSVEDYLLAASKWSAAFPEEATPPWIEFQRFVAAEAHVIEKHIRSYPQLFFQQAYNQAKSGPLHEACERELALGRGPEGYWFERVNRPSRLQVSPCIFTLPDFAGQVYSVAFSEDGATIATASTGPGITISSADTGATHRTLEGHGGAVAELLWTSDHLLLSASWDATVRVWDPYSGECYRVLSGHTGPVTCLQLIDGNRCVTAGFDGSVRVWNFRTGDADAVFEGHSRAVVAAFACGSGRILSAAEDGTIRIWPLDSEGTERVLRPGASPISCLAPFAAGRAGVGFQDGQIEIWDLDREVREVVLKGHLGAVAGVAQDDAGRYWSWSYDYTIRTWSPTGESEWILRDHDSAVNRAAISGKWLVSASQDGTLRVWELNTGECKAVLRDHRAWITALATGRQGRIASGSWDRTVRIWDLPAAASSPPQELAPILPDIRQARWLFRVVLRDATTALSLTYGPQHVQIWDLESGECTRIAAEESDPEYEEVLRIQKQSSESGGWTFCGREDIDDWGLAIGMSVAIGNETAGIGCVFARRMHVPGYPDMKGGSQYEPDNIALYPLRAGPFAEVFETDRTIAFDQLSREAHVLRLRKPVLKSPQKE